MTNVVGGEEAGQVIEKKHRQLQLITHSEIQCFQRCPREHHFKYRLLRHPKGDEAPLVFGRLIDVCLETWWSIGPLHGKSAMLAKLEEIAKETTPAGKLRHDLFDVEKARALLIGYDARWSNEPYEILRVQPVFRTPIVNPKTARPSNTFELGGKLDVIVRDIRTNETIIVETKTTVYDIAIESSYWHTISVLDPQVSTYYKGARELDFEAQRCVYDVIRKPQLRPYKATPEAERKYTQSKTKKCPECKKKKPVFAAPHTFEVKDGEHTLIAEDLEAIPGAAFFLEEGREIFKVVCLDGEIVTDPGGKLWANMRLEDETPNEYFIRVAEEILEAPGKYYARGDIVRLEQDEIEHSDDVWHTARVMRENELARRAPRHRGSCKRFGRMCGYFAVCSGIATIESFPQSDMKHEELKEI